MKVIHCVWVAIIVVGIASIAGSICIGANEIETKPHGCHRENAK